MRVWWYRWDSLGHSYPGWDRHLGLNVYGGTDGEDFSVRGFPFLPSPIIIMKHCAARFARGRPHSKFEHFECGIIMLHGGGCIICCSCSYGTPITSSTLHLTKQYLCCTPS